MDKPAHHIHPHRRNGRSVTRYGYIGLGMMGAAMTENLVGASVEAVSVFDLNAKAVDTAVQHGAQAAGSAAEVAANSDVVSICVPAAEHIQAVLTGPGGIAEGAHANLTLLIHSTVHPDTVLEAQNTAAAWDVKVFDACVAGGATQAVAGTQTVLAGGVDRMPANAIELLNIYADKIISAGPVGSGAALKIAVNVMTYAQFAAAATSHDLMTSSGADPASLFEAWEHMGQLGSLTKQYSAMLGIPPEHITGDFLTGMVTQVGIARKDLSLAMSLGDTRIGTTAVLRSIHDAMPGIYNVADHF